jgi:hypothetical protein
MRMCSKMCVEVKVPWNKFLLQELIFYQDNPTCCGYLNFFAVYAKALKEHDKYLPKYPLNISSLLSLNSQ